jgi:hypothetical protein
MALNKVKHIITEMEGVRCSVVETGVSEERMTFLKSLLEHNKYEVKILSEKKENSPVTYTVGVTDVLFNPVLVIYERTLMSQDGFKVTPAFWNQDTTVFDPRYWLMRRRKKRVVE